MVNNSKGSVLELFISVKGYENRFEKDKLILDEQGVQEDKFYAKNTQRAILIASIDSYEIASLNGISAPHSSLGENILVDINLYHLVPGNRLEIGNTLLEITQNCTICNSLSKVDSALPELLKNDRGIFAKVINSGTINREDSINILK
ncbi:MAG: MOSC domain-containing protein YiiM [Sulfurimonas sp.]|jgi:MOSC domain-containing protein YiiM